MKRVLVVATAAAALTMLAVVLYEYAAHRSAPRVTVVSVPPPGEVAPAALPSFEFIPLDEPRSLPELRFVDGDGSALSLTDLRGRLVLLNIWATWCAPCRREMPTLDRLQAELGGADFEVVALSIDRQGVPAVKAFYQELGLEALRIYVDKSTKASRDLGILGIPTTLLIGRQGRELGRVVGPAEWDSPEAVALVRRYLERPSARDVSSRDSREQRVEPD
ncbi:MAG: TlpA family protein disulfide reductase [Alphaproteobacteria bacterium]